MNPEKKFQNFLLKLGKAEEKTRVFKCSDRFVSGIPDLYCCSNGISGWIELKYDTKKFKVFPYKINPDLTELQKKFIRDELRAGGIAGWALGFEMDEEQWVKIGSNPEEETPVYMRRSLICMQDIMIAIKNCSDAYRYQLI